jgi:hypothetical protein
MMKVYGVHYGNDHDGCYSAIGLFKNKKDAEFCFISTVYEANDMGSDYELAGMDYYRDGSDYIKIIETEVL